MLVLEAGRPDYRWDVFIHMPAALMFPIGSRFYDWKYESEPEPFMNGRRVYHARGKVLGGSSSINGMIFQRGNPLDFERWAADPGMANWDYANCLPYFKRMETCLAGPDEYRGGDGPLELERGPATNPLFDAFFEAVQQAGYVLTSDVNGYRQEGFAAFDRNLRRGRRLSAARAYLHPVMRRPNLDVRYRAHVSRLVIDGTRVTGVEYTTPGRRRHVVTAGEVILCGGAFNSPQLLQVSGIGNAEHLRSVGCHAGPPPARRRRAPPGPSRGLRPARQHAAGVVEPADEVAEPSVDRAAVVGPPGTRREQPLRGGRLRPQQRRRRLPQPDVPLPADRGALRRLGAGRRARLPGARRADVLGSRGSVQITSPDVVVKPALRFNYLSTDQDRREWVEAIRIARHILGQPAFDALRRRRGLAGTRCADRRRDPRLGRP